jgi:hypothetical protein
MIIAYALTSAVGLGMLWVAAIFARSSLSVNYPQVGLAASTSGICRTATTGHRLVVRIQQTNSTFPAPPWR